VNPIAIVVHGGAWDVPNELTERCSRGVERAVHRGWVVLQSGGSALDACEQAIIELEEDSVFDAGIGSHLNRDGKAQLDAVIMDGRTLNSGAVACVERIRNPIRLARLVLERSEHMLLAGYGAEQFAIENGLPLSDPSIFSIPEELRRWSERTGSAGGSLGTVGTIALDHNGNLAAGTSTGGTFFKYPGRIGDSPLIGCGCYADNEGAAVSATGHGESVMKIVMSKLANDFVNAGQPPQTAADAALAVLQRRTTGRAGLIILDRSGRVGTAFTTNNLVRAYRTSDSSEAIVAV
jgi:beta-aspartyl-peptidase (threonine type)